MTVSGAAAVAPVPAGGSPGLYPTVADPAGRSYVGGRSYYAEPALDSSQRGTLWAQVGAFRPAWANPWGYSVGYATPSTVFGLIGTTLPAAGFDTDGDVAQQGVSPGASGSGETMLGG